MYKKAKTDFDHACFKEVFTKTTNFHYNEPTGREMRFLFLKTGVDPEHYTVEDVIGTAEINPFHPESGSIVQPYTDTILSEHEKIKPYKFDTFEIGKLCIKEEYQKLGYITRLFSVICEHQRETKAKQYLSQMVLPLYEMLTSSLELNLHVLGEPDRDEIPGIPVLLNFEDSMNNKKVQRLLRRRTKIMI